MNQDDSRQNIFSQQESVQVLIVKLKTTEDIRSDTAFRNAWLEIENESLRQQLAQSQTQIAELESQVEGLDDLCKDLSSQIPYAGSPHCEFCGRSS